LFFEGLFEEMAGPVERSGWTSEKVTSYASRLYFLLIIFQVPLFRYFFHFPPLLYMMLVAVPIIFPLLLWN
jgi:hypothetical protein